MTAHTEKQQETKKNKIEVQQQQQARN